MAKFLVLALFLGAASAKDECSDMSQARCKSASACTWCKAGAVPSSCFNVDDAKRLPPGVFECDNKRPDYAKLWKEFQAAYSKKYAHAEEQQRFETFTANVDWIEAENSKGHSHMLGVTPFADLTADEFKNRYLGYDPSLRKAFLQAVPWQMPNVTAPDAIDWVTKGGVTPVKNQGSCGSCWAFSTTGAVEGAYFASSGKLVSLSEQELVLCDMSDKGCKGGAMDNGFEFVKQYGLCSESADPYTLGAGTNGQCKTECGAVVAVTGHTDVPPNDEAALKAAVALQPVSVAIEADQKVFQLYTGGILDNAACGTKLDHGVLVVGYGSENGQDYWKVKNSWGGFWGEQGYIRIARGSNMCGIAMQASYPIGAKAAGQMPKPPVPDPTPTPAPGATPHYEDPKDGCQSDEKAIKIQGISGEMCSPACVGPTSNGMNCPKDVPSGVTATPQCALKTPTREQYCALVCTPSSAANECGQKASCKSISGAGICTYDDAARVTLTTTLEDFSEIVV